VGVFGGGRGWVCPTRIFQTLEEIKWDILFQQGSHSSADLKCARRARPISKWNKQYKDILRIYNNSYNLPYQNIHTTNQNVF